jgi:hypothetical protein
MARRIDVSVHEIATDGLPPRDGDMAGRYAFIFDGCIVSGWPWFGDEGDGAYGGYWIANSDVGRVNIKFSGVTHWIEFPEPLHSIGSGMA